MHNHHSYTLIQSPENAKFKLLKKLLISKSERYERGCFILDHTPALMEHLQDHPERISTLIVPEACESIPSQFKGDVWELSQSLWRQISIVGSPSPMIGLMHIPVPVTLDTLLERATRLLILDHLQSPTNVGAIIRSAVAFGIDGVLLLQTADPLHPDALRAMAGRCYDIPFLTISPEALYPHLKEWTVLGLDPHATDPLHPYPPETKLMVILGSEGHGITAPIVYSPVRLPTIRPLESLNVAVAAGIALFSLSQSNCSDFRKE